MGVGDRFPVPKCYDFAGISLKTQMILPGAFGDMAGMSAIDLPQGILVYIAPQRTLYKPAHRKAPVEKISSV